MRTPVFLIRRLARLLALAALFAGAASARATPHNVLLIIADDLGVDSFPLTATAGASVPPMPNLTALKNSGVLFRNARSQPTCSPTRASMLTGRHPFRTGIGTALTSATSPQLQASEFTLPEAFAANAGLGYSLAMFGKWHLNSGPGTNDTPRTIGGWPHFAGTIAGALPDYSAWTKITDNVSTATTAYATTDTADDTIAWITSHPTQPWMIWAAFNAPHAPLHFPPNDLHSYDAAATTNRNQYEAMCEAFDTEVGRVLAHVNLATTNVIFVGDNGTPQNVIQTPYNSSHSKGTLYEGGTRVPLIIAGPVVVNPNRESTAPVNCVDLYSTILELAGIDVTATQPAANPIDSKSLLPILQDTIDVERVGFSQTFGSDIDTTASGRAITDAAGFTLIQFDDGHEEFFDTTTDGNQQTNLLGSTISNTAQAAYAALKLKLADFTASGVPNTPLVTSWFTANTGRYARIYQTLDDMNNHNAVDVWNRGAGVQNSPTYAGVHQVDFSDDWVYIHTTGLGSHVMGPWYLNALKTNLFPNYPSNTATIFRFPRAPAIPPTKTLFGGGNVGYFVDGVSMFDIRDAFYWNGTADVAGNGYWNRDAYVNESVTFDNAGAHQAGKNHHYHANPKALRHLLGDHVNFNATTNVYAENPANLHHSPIIGWAADGLPIYGPYGFSDPTNAGSAIRRMVGGFALRNGTNGTDNLTATGRTTIPAWAQRAYNVAANVQAGPAVSGTYPLGRYLEDNAYLGDLGYTQTTGATIRDFDLDEYNVRFCVTPEFPAGTWAYFLCVAADGTPLFPYQVGRSYFGDPTGGTVTAITEPVATSFVGGPFKADRAGTAAVNASTGDVTVTWTAIEGGIYRIEASEQLTSWSTLAPSVTVAGSDIGGVVESGGALGEVARFYRTVRTGVATYDKTGFAGTVFSTSIPTGDGPNTVKPNSGSLGGSGTVIIELDPNQTPSLPPAQVAVYSVTAGTGITVSNISRPSQTLVQATFTIDAGTTTGARTVAVRFNNATGVLRTLTNAFTVY